MRDEGIKMECVDVACKIIEFIYYLLPNLLWVFVGFGFGLVAYWWRIGQLRNEFSSLSHLFRVRFVRGDEFIIRAGVDLKAVDGTGPYMVSSDSQMIFGYERGVDWIFCSQKGLIRTRVVYASFKNDLNPIPKYYVVSHTYIK